ncbi:glycine cleavage system P-protein-domain-containing protein, partial [Dimargaris cristalligena]
MLSRSILRQVPSAVTAGLARPALPIRTALHSTANRAAIRGSTSRHVAPSVRLLSSFSQSNPRASQHIAAATAPDSTGESAADSPTSNYHSSHPPTGQVFPSTDVFETRHNGSTPEQVKAMLQTLGLTNMEDLLQRAVPPSIRLAQPLQLAPGVAEAELLASLKAIASRNEIYKSYIGMGYTDTQVPAVILRSIMENPGWYTQYTPYQPEISQGRLESLFNYQTMVSDLTGLPIANASLLDEGTAAAEAMAMAFAAGKKKRRTFFVDHACHPQTLACVRTRAEGFGVQVA